MFSYDGTPQPDDTITTRRSRPIAQFLEGVGAHRFWRAAPGGESRKRGGAFCGTLAEVCIEHAAQEGLFQAVARKQTGELFVSAIDRLVIDRTRRFQHKPRFEIIQELG